MMAITTLATTATEGLNLWVLIVTGVIAVFGAAAGIFSRSQIQLIKSRADELGAQLELERDERRRDRVASDARLALYKGEVDILKSGLIAGMGDDIANRVLLALKLYMDGRPI